MRICASCGIIAPFQKASCAHCAAPFSPQIPQSIAEAPGRNGSVLFACVYECDFACSACGLRSPLGHVAMSGQVECAGCGLRQAFDPVQWTEALIHAHNVVDLAGPNPEGANPNPSASIAGRSQHGKIGTEYTSSTKTQATTIMDASGTRKHTLKTTVCPGHPLCLTCKVPLNVSSDVAATRTQCPRCNDVAVYALPQGANAYQALRGVIAADNRSDRPIARVTQGQGGIEALACPQCGAALAAGAGEIVKCQFCNLVAKVPGKLARNQKSGAPDPIKPFWLLLEGSSRGRRKLILGENEDADDDDARDFESSPPPRYQQQGPVGQLPPNYAQMQAANASSMVKIIVAITIGFVVLLLLGGAAVAFFVLRSAPDTAPVQAPAPQAPPRRNK